MNKIIYSFIVLIFSFSFTQKVSAQSNYVPDSVKLLGNEIIANTLKDTANKLKSDGKISKIDVDKILAKYLNDKETITENSNLIVVKTNSSGIAEVGLKDATYKVSANNISGVDISIPEEIDPSSDKRIEVGIKPGSGQVTKIKKNKGLFGFLIPHSVSAANETFKTTIVNYFDKNGNGKWDRSENIIPWAGVTITLEDVNAVKNLNKPTDPNSNSDTQSAEPVPFFKIYVP